MKVRTGFVSNSSSASFTIKVSNLEAWQLVAILTHDYGEDVWDNISVVRNNREDVEEQFVEGFTIMDNFDMHTFLTKTLKIKDKFIDWWDG
jgi:hypothetical protein